MSNKTRLQTNNTNLQVLINKANALPDAGGDSGGGETISITINGYFDSAFSYAGYFDSAGVFMRVTSASTVKALGGIIMIYNSMGGSGATGSYTQGIVGHNNQYCFLSDGGIVTLYGSD